MITENLSTLQIHKLTQEQYDREVEAGRIDETAMYLTPDEEITPENIGARPDTWMPTAAEVGAAPAGYGLGGDMRVFKFSELDTLRTTGWYFLSEMGSQVGSVWVNFAFCRVMGHSDQVIQELFPVQSTTKIMRFGYVDSDGNVNWGDWVAKNWGDLMTSANFSYSDGTLYINT